MPNVACRQSWILLFCDAAIATTVSLKFLASATLPRYRFLEVSGSTVPCHAARQLFIGTNKQSSVAAGNRSTVQHHSDVIPVYRNNNKAVHGYSI